jgi:hypothetical protein
MAAASQWSRARCIVTVRAPTLAFATASRWGRRRHHAAVDELVRHPLPVRGESGATGARSTKTVVLKEGTSTMFEGQIRATSPQAGSSTMSVVGKMRKAYDASQEMVPFEVTLTCKDMSEFGSD